MQFALRYRGREANEYRVVKLSSQWNSTCTFFLTGISTVCCSRNLTNFFRSLKCFANMASGAQNVHQEVGRLNQLGFQQSQLEFYGEGVCPAVDLLTLCCFNQIIIKNEVGRPHSFINLLLVYYCQLYEQFLKPIISIIKYHNIITLKSKTQL